MILRYVERYERLSIYPFLCLELVIFRNKRQKSISAGICCAVSEGIRPETLENFTPRTIVVTSGKGGVGKTTTTANIGMSIARLGYRVALIDSDIGLRNLDLLLGLENRILYTAMDVIEGQCRLDQALIKDKRWKNLALLSISKIDKNIM